jgi:outer membrane protein OmpA-like peptidoglycan-associated protein
MSEGGTLYFASNGHNGLGGLDIYASKYVSGNWSAPKNLGAPINSASDDFDYILRSDNQSGYFCSNRAGGAGDDDIYSFARKGLVLPGITYDARTGDPLEGAVVTVIPATKPDTMITSKDGGFTCSAGPNTDYVFNAVREGYYPATFKYHLAEIPGLVRIPMYPIGDIKLEVTVIDKNTRELLYNAGVKITNLHLLKQKTLHTDEEGKCVATVDSNAEYRIEAWKETGPEEKKYLNASAEISTRSVDSSGWIRQVIELERSQDKIALKNIYYDLDKWFIRTDAASELDKLVRIMKDNPGINIELGSHTDCRETEEYNMVLSQKRAQSAVDYIVLKGIDKNRMVAVGYGKTRLINNCNCQENEVPCTEEQHQQNRRTEFMVTKKLLTLSRK